MKIVNRSAWLLPARIIGYNLGHNFFRKSSFLSNYPFNYTFCLTRRCNLRCRTCRIWSGSGVNGKDLHDKDTYDKDDYDQELSFEEWKKIIESLGRMPVWITITGGEPFLRDDIYDILSLIINRNQPLFLNVASNGILCEKIFKVLKKIDRELDSKGVNFNLNLSLDGNEKTNDSIRGKGAFKKTIRTYDLVKGLKNINTGFNLTLSKYNEQGFEKFYSELIKEYDCQISVEFAQNRIELNNLNEDILPGKKKVERIIEFMLNQKRQSGLRSYLRHNYYLLIKQVIKHKEANRKAKNTKNRCFAGLASIYISPEGKLIDCPKLFNAYADLKEYDLDFMKCYAQNRKTILDKIRKRDEKSCSCGLANANYTNMLCKPTELLQDMIKPRR